MADAQPLPWMQAGTRGRSSQPPVRHGSLPKSFRHGFADPILVCPLPLVRRRNGSWVQPDSGGTPCMSYPVTPFGHLQRLTDNIGLLRDADGVVPLHGHGYYADDVARGLLVVCREPSPTQELVVLGRRYLYFLAQAQALGGKFRNHLGYDRRWHDAARDRGRLGLFPPGRWAPPPRAARPRGYARRPSPGSTAARGSPHPGRTPWHSRRSARPRYSTRSPATLARSRCSTGRASSSASRPRTRRGRGRRPGSAPPTRPSPRPSSCPAATSRTTGCCERAAHARVAAGHARPGTATCPWCPRRDGAPARTGPPRSAAGRGSRAGRRVHARGGGHRRQTSGSRAWR